MSRTPPARGTTGWSVDLTPCRAAVTLVLGLPTLLVDVVLRAELDRCRAGRAPAARDRR